MDFTNFVQNAAIYALPVIFAITLHEAAHAFVAKRFGDSTAFMLGRMTLNPLKHIDPFGTLLLPAVLLLTTSALPGGPYALGYAKPVPVRWGNLRNPKRDMVWVALAGPLSNFIQAFFWAVLLLAFSALGVQEPFFLKMAAGGVFFNILLAVFNLFPIPPLDGGRVAVGLLPWSVGQHLARVEPFGFFIVIGLMVAQVLHPVWISPLMSASYAVLDIILIPLRWILQ